MTVSTADDFKSFVASLDAALPTKVPIVFLPIKPSIKRWALRPLQEDANRRIAEFTKSAPDRFHFIDLSSTLLAKDGKPVALQGMSLFWSQWIGKYYTAGTVKWLKDDWKCSIVRAAIAADEGGYLKQPKVELAKAEAVIDAAVKEGIYVIVDWHDHKAEAHTAQSVEFFSAISKKYGKNKNVIYEIYNEPLKVSWKDTIKDRNVAYTLHFYAAGHKQYLRDKAQKALNAGIPLVITEWGTVNYDGNGAVDDASTKEWLAFAKKNSLTMCNWSVADKVEGAAVLKPGANTQGNWPASQLTDAGKYVREIIRGWK